MFVTVMMVCHHNGCKQRVRVQILVDSSRDRQERRRSSVDYAPATKGSAEKTYVDIVRETFDAGSWATRS